MVRICNLTNTDMYNKGVSQNCENFIVTSILFDILNFRKVNCQILKLRR